MKTTNSGPITIFKELPMDFLYSTDVDRISLSKRNNINAITTAQPNLGIPGVVTIETTEDTILTNILTPSDV
jgi:hypothetical protein